MLLIICLFRRLTNAGCMSTRSSAFFLPLSGTFIPSHHHNSYIILLFSKLDEIRPLSRSPPRLLAGPEDARPFHRSISAGHGFLPPAPSRLHSLCRRLVQHFS